MRTHHILAALLAPLLLFASDAIAINETHWPSTLMDSDCTDSFDTPAIQSGGSVAPAAQTSGSGDGYCDHDSRIFTGALLDDQLFAAITVPNGHKGLVIFADADTVAAPTGTWHFRLYFAKPHDDGTDLIQAFAGGSTEGDKVFLLYPHAAADWTGADSFVNAPVPRTFKIYLLLGTATSWTGDISWLSF